ncbi:2-oxoglutarate dehydrogenase complex dihydrolipoyllysine-residue succinyltransferase [Thiosocius teredinicola]|uniref:2-oxoglutarate dehydrogenase complex dihydrolipoyllysine-residue succinyltransferase n=1 Tax=Thiosocius teredinicola TaxID=1973002 RepID=UPI000990A578
MSTEVRVPTLPESVSDATVLTWHKKPGEAIARDENLVDLETDKVVLEVPSPVAGVLREAKVDEGAVVTADELLAIVEAGAEAAVEPVTEPPTSPDKVEETAAAAEPAPAAASPAASAGEDAGDQVLTPAVRRLVKELNVDASKIKGTGKNGRILKSDVMAFLDSAQQTEDDADVRASVPSSGEQDAGLRQEKRVPMTRLRSRIAERLLEAQQNAAILTTFNEVNLKEAMDLRAKHKDAFEKAHDVRLGFMSFFVRAAVEALKKFPVVNASVDGNDIVYHNYFDIGVAVGSPRGLVVPILRNADQMSFAEIEGTIKAFGQKAKDGSLSYDELTGGTFTISNGGVFGSMLSTPILNPPQSAILGMHNIVDRPVVENGEIVIRPMMYLALSYDHRIIDGREAVQFLVTIKNCMEDPARMLLQV